MCWKHTVCCHFLLEIPVTVAAAAAVAACLMQISFISIQRELMLHIYNFRLLLLPKPELLFGKTTNNCTADQQRLKSQCGKPTIVLT